MQDHQYFYKTLDNPIRVLFWTVDEFLILITPLFLSLCLGNVFLLFGGIILKPCYSKIKRKFPNGLFKHKLYWSLPHNFLERTGKTKHLPPSHVRELLL